MTSGAHRFNRNDMGGHVGDCCALTEVNNLCNNGNTLVYITLTVNNSPLRRYQIKYQKKISLKFSSRPI